MAKYKVDLLYSTTLCIYVEAESEDEAIENAAKEACRDEYDDDFKLNATLEDTIVEEL